jgi:hypothetical protein
MKFVSRFSVNGMNNDYKKFQIFIKDVGSKSKKTPEKIVSKTVEKYYSSKEKVEKEKTVQIYRSLWDRSSKGIVEKENPVQFPRSLWNPPIKNSEKPKARAINITNDKKDLEKSKTDV